MVLRTIVIVGSLALIGAACSDDGLAGSVQFDGGSITGEVAATSDPDPGTVGDSVEDVASIADDDNPVTDMKPDTESRAERSPVKDGVAPGSSASADMLGPGTALLVPVEAGDSGQEVQLLQDRLNELGFAPGQADGSYGPRTIAAVEAFQELAGLTRTGAANEATLTALTDYRYLGPMLHAGDDGREVEELQARLGDGPFDPGPADGEYGPSTVAAVWALEKLAGVPLDGDWGPLDERAWDLLIEGKIGRPEKSHEIRWVEIDLSEQLLKVYDPGSTTPVLISHASSGSGVPWANEGHSGNSITPLGLFHIDRRISGWRESSLNIGRLYNPLYFNGGIALHGSGSVPLYPASHGCVRLPMHIADYLPSELPNGTPVHVLA